jgi:hypothetical protein
MTAKNARRHPALATQLAINAQSWQALAQRGAGTRAVRLDFFYLAPNEQHAKALAAFLSAETDYEVCVTSSTAGLWRKTSWTVNGTTDRGTISREILDHWVMAMLSTGHAHACSFAGWGAQVS